MAQITIQAGPFFRTGDLLYVYLRSLFDGSVRDSPDGHASIVAPTTSASVPSSGFVTFTDLDDTKQYWVSNNLAPYDYIAITFPDPVAAEEEADDIIQDEGIDLPDRGYLNFVGAGVTATDDPDNNAIVVTIPGGGGGGGGAIEWYDFTAHLYPAAGTPDWAAGAAGPPQIGVSSGLIFFRGSIEMVGASEQGVVIVDSPFMAIPEAYRPTAARFMTFFTSSFSDDPDEVGWQGTLRLSADGHFQLYTTLSTMMRNGARRATSGFQPQDTILLDGLFCAV